MLLWKHTKEGCCYQKGFGQGTGSSDEGVSAAVLSAYLLKSSKSVGHDVS